MLMVSMSRPRRHLRCKEAGRVDCARPGPSSQGIAPRPERGLAVIVQLAALDGLRY